MSRNQVAEILDPQHTLQKRLGKITDLAQRRGNKGGNEIQGERNVREDPKQPQQKTEDKCRCCSAKTAFNRLVRADMRSQLMLSEANSTE